VGEWHKVELKISKTKASYSVDGHLFSVADLSSDVHQEGYIGMISYASTYLYRNLTITQ